VRVLKRAEQLKVNIRPHVKTHKTLEVSKIIQEEGEGILQEGRKVVGIVASTISEMEFFAEGGHNDITYATPFHISRLDRVLALRHCLPSFVPRLMVDSVGAVEELETALAERGETGKIHLFVKLDCGYHRAGIDISEGKFDVLESVVKAIAAGKHTEFFGLYAHSGNTYNCKGGVQEAAQIADREAELSATAARYLKSLGLYPQAVGVGSTPSATAVSPLPPEITEIHPGNFVFYDLQQVDSGSCTLPDIAVGVLSRVVSVYPERNEALIDAGGTAVHKDSGGISGWGRVDGHPDLLVKRMSQEVSVIGMDPSASSVGLPIADRFSLGSMVTILPNHSCMSACQHAQYSVLEKRGDREVVDTWTPCKYW